MAHFRASIPCFAGPLLASSRVTIAAAAPAASNEADNCMIVQDNDPVEAAEEGFTLSFSTSADVILVTTSFYTVYSDVQSYIERYCSVIMNSALTAR